MQFTANATDVPGPAGGLVFGEDSDSAFAVEWGVTARQRDYHANSPPEYTPTPTLTLAYNHYLQSSLFSSSPRSWRPLAVFTAIWISAHRLLPRTTTTSKAAYLAPRHEAGDLSRFSPRSGYPHNAFYLVQPLPPKQPIQHLATKLVTSRGFRRDLDIRTTPSTSYLEPTRKQCHWVCDEDACQTKGRLAVTGGLSAVWFVNPRLRSSQSRRFEAQEPIRRRGGDYPIRHAGGYPERKKALANSISRTSTKSSPAPKTAIPGATSPRRRLELSDDEDDAPSSNEEGMQRTRPCKSACPAADSRGGSPDCKKAPPKTSGPALSTGGVRGTDMPRPPLPLLSLTNEAQAKRSPTTATTAICRQRPAAKAGLHHGAKVFQPSQQRLCAGSDRQQKPDYITAQRFLIIASTSGAGGAIIFSYPTPSLAYIRASTIHTPTVCTHRPARREEDGRL
ncbi:hypothetical protein FN846DRAFT_1023509 [Sphaerosporella brunnea]|uniref:Uncharacterized protein n=1 Tax=Sphaerosporella brunnea TaxID=1250544 RepID=A0A5J5EQI0_9PEZI|nr:hypothetical protein FN846DRAFT_1023509 [Sphaerosporella brunnea]